MHRSSSTSRRRHHRLARSVWLAALPVASLLATMQPAVAAPSVVVNAVGSTNVYSDVIQQIGGTHVSVVGILSNPNGDPHIYESSTADAALVARATLVVQNGIGYDAFINKLEAASPNARRTMIDVGARLGYKNGDNPHLWYNPATMPKVAAFIAAELSRQDPADKRLFERNLRSFDNSLKPWATLMNTINSQYGGTPVAITEPVFGYALAAMGLDALTPPSFAQAIQQSNDPSPQDVQVMQVLLSQNKVRCFFYNQQVVAPITAKLLEMARAHHVPIVGVYETKPLHMQYQQWVLAEARATDRALSRHLSTEQLR
ncbi:MAG: periplasmic solute binding protein [Chloroflexi bacterium]|nr:periplasmic solute binding protein [Chloroflexota bacterium]